MFCNVKGTLLVSVWIWGVDKITVDIDGGFVSITVKSVVGELTEEDVFENIPFGKRVVLMVSIEFAFGMGDVLISLVDLFDVNVLTIFVVNTGWLTVDSFSPV